MTSIPTYALVLTASGLLGVLYFGGLWWTTKVSLRSKRPAAWIFGSFLVRLALAMTGFALISGNDWKRWLVCVLGFLIGRAIVQRVTRPPEQQRRRPDSETHHAA